MSSSQDAPRIIRISSAPHETNDSHEGSPDVMNLSDSPTLSRFGHFVFDDDQSGPNSSGLDLSALDFALYAILARDSAEQHDYHSSSESEDDSSNESQPELVEKSSPPPPRNPTPTIPPLSESGPLDGTSLGAVMDELFQPCVQDLVAKSGNQEDEDVSSDSIDSSSTESDSDDKDQGPSGDQNTTDSNQDDNTMDMSQRDITNYIRQMMFVSGETAEPSVETTTLIEEITRQQVIEILTRSTALATRRGSRSISTEDLIMLIRHDKAKVSRLRTFLSWKEVRKNVKDSDDKGGADAADFAAADDAAGVVAGPSDVASKPKNKRARVGLPWDVNSFFSVPVPEREDEEDEEEEEQNYATLQRLAAADERTKNMTKEEYVFWSECRQASFTYRKSKRFREWAGFGIVTESKPNDDIVDILGFLTFEIVQTLTEKALKVKADEDFEKNRGGAEAGDSAKKRKRETSLFDPPEEGRTPIEPRHVHEAFRRLQATPNRAKAMLLHNGRVPARFPLQLI